jgi:HNH endonuclease
MKENERYGRLVTVKQLEKGAKSTNKPSIWLCKCDCGNEKVTKGAYLRAGVTRSCGCLVTKNDNEYDEQIRKKIESNIHINENGCWIWKGAKHRQGYGNIAYRCRAQLVHRVSWVIYKGKIPKGIKVCHKCDITSCCNPHHLFLGTQKDNVYDAVEKGKFDQRKLGKRRNKLNWDQVQEVKKLNAQGMSRQKIQEKFQVGQTCIAKILQGVSWNKNWTEEL